MPDLADAWLARLLSWADDYRRLGVRANADYPPDAKRAREYGAEGIGLCRTEHMFFETDRLPLMQRMIMSDSVTERRDALEELRPLQRADFLGLFHAMDGLPVIIRLVDPPLHEFLPTVEELTKRITDAKIRLSAAGSLDEIDELLAGCATTRTCSAGCGRCTSPTRCSASAACGWPPASRDPADAGPGDLRGGLRRRPRAGGRPRPEIMVPLTSDAGELIKAREMIESEAAAVFTERGISHQLPGRHHDRDSASRSDGRASRRARRLLLVGSNDLTQTTYALSRDDAETSFLVDYLRTGVFDHDPFTSLDPDGVGTSDRHGHQCRHGRAATASRSASAVNTVATRPRSPGATSTA